MMLHRNLPHLPCQFAKCRLVTVQRSQLMTFEIIRFAKIESGIVGTFCPIYLEDGEARRAIRILLEQTRRTEKINPFALVLAIMQYPLVVLVTCHRQIE